MLVKPLKGSSMRRQDMMDARTAVEEILGGKTSCDMLIEGIAFDRGPTGEVTNPCAQSKKSWVSQGSPLGRGDAVFMIVPIAFGRVE